MYIGVYRDNGLEITIADGPDHRIDPSSCEAAGAWRSDLSPIRMQVASSKLTGVSRDQGVIVVRDYVPLFHTKPKPLNPKPTYSLIPYQPPVSKDGLPLQPVGPGTSLATS